MSRRYQRISGHWIYVAQNMKYETPRVYSYSCDKKDWTVQSRKLSCHRKKNSADIGLEFPLYTVMLIKFLPYSGATAQTRSVALWGLSGSYGQAPAQQGMSGLVRETSHLWLYSSLSPSLQPTIREPATSILIVLYTFECIMWVATESLWGYVQGNKWILKLHFHNFFAMWLKWCTETTY